MRHESRDARAIGDREHARDAAAPLGRAVRPGYRSRRFRPPCARQAADTLAVLEEATHVIKELAEGRAVQYEDTTLRLEWAPKHRLPVWIAGYGPKALEVTARIADGAIIQLADPSLVGWCVDLHPRWREEGRPRSERDPGDGRSCRVRRPATSSRSSAPGGSPRSCRITSSTW